MHDAFPETCTESFLICCRESVGYLPFQPISVDSVFLYMTNFKTYYHDITCVFGKVSMLCNKEYRVLSECGVDHWTVV